MINAGVLANNESKPSVVSVATSEHSEVNNQISSYSGLFLHMSDGFAYCEAIFEEHGKPIDYVFVDVNKSFKRITKLSGKVLIGRKVTDVMPSLKAEPFDWIGTCGKVALAGRSMIFERYCKALDKWLLVNAYCPQKGHFAMLIRDVTQHKKAEQALRHSEKQYKRLTNSITDPFFALDACLRFTYWNKASEKIMGVSAANALNKGFFEVFEKDKATRKALRTYLNVMRTGKSRCFVGKLPKANNFLFEIQVNSTGNGISVFAKDITEQQKLQDTLQQYTIRLEELVKARTQELKDAERMATIGETAGMVGHDIRNPLQSIIGELYLAKVELNAIPESEEKKTIAESINCIEEQTLYINKIVSDLQDYAKPTVPAIQETDLNEIIKASMSTLKNPDNVKISYFVQKPFPILKTDPSFIRRILTNLTLNGIQAMQEKGGEISINAFRRPKSVILAVSDSGVGIPEAALEKIFKPLFTTKSKGQGFGLAVVKKLVDALDGEISFETQAGKGTTFIIEMPLLA